MRTIWKAPAEELGTAGDPKYESTKRTPAENKGTAEGADISRDRIYTIYNRTRPSRGGRGSRGSHPLNQTPPLSTATNRHHPTRAPPATREGRQKGEILSPPCFHPTHPARVARDGRQHGNRICGKEVYEAMPPHRDFI